MDARLAAGGSIAGNIPGRTQTLSSAIFQAQQVGDTKTGNTLMVIAIVIGFVAIFTAETLSDRRGPLQPRSKRAN